MKPEKDHIKEIFNSKLNNFEAIPPASMWDKIDAGLTSDKLQQKPKPRNIIFKVASWSAGIAAAVLAVFLLLPDQTDNGHIAGTFINQPHIPETNIESKDKISQPERTEIDRNSLQQSYSKPILAEIPKAKEPITELNQPPATITTETENTDKTAGTVDQKNTEAATTQPILASAQPQKKEKNTDPDFEKNLQKQIEAFEAQGKSETLFAENKTEKTSSEKESLSLGFNGGGAFSKADGYKRIITASANENQQMTLRAENVKLEHNQPITFGVSINKKINNRLSVESGITYTYLSSKVKSSLSTNYSKNDMQYLHYLGIPLTMNYNFAEWKNVHFYISAGGAIQKDFYGRLKQYQGANNLSGSQTPNNKNISQKNPQFSLSSSLGASYPIYKNMSVYTSVGGAYYLDAKNEYETIFSDKKWLLNLNLGIKFGF
ncbi:porin family protein [Dysgonomonas macrotermitis]|uniref:Outer membrane protein beta-barrel domain-containing protein n=1 Tax=Dysgonomonas macrotermitis TaxID=1346286 RepID=A0A1M4WSV9_9BACT|nr:outer membrane beta-barrel protein [Dysgonomonas macrotermitis]SHE84295.1 hypothetical protein SAMN05444362_102307 [Dysgonomonas macrotermitis]